MRTRLVALSAVVCFGVLLVAGPALARSSDADRSEFPDLPGMGVADRASRGEVADFRPKGSDESTSGTTTTSSSSSGGVSGSTASNVTKADGVDPSPILELPGTSSLPLISEVRVGLASVKRGIESMPRGLAALAALGTLLSVGGFLALRRALVP